jgi:hypothetical protein
MFTEAQWQASIAKLATEFAAELTQSLTVAEAFQVAEAQGAETDDTVCHLHDVCDANMVMEAAFKRVFNDEPDLNDEDLDVALWNAAWPIGRQAFFARVLP